jgi:hypothetical protein
VASALVAIAFPSSTGTVRLPTLHVAPNGGENASCTAFAPCSSFGRAYVVARPGQKVVVAPGHYRAQAIPFNRAKDAAGTNVRFLAKPGAVVDGDLVVRGSHVTVRGAASSPLRLHTLISRVTGANATSHQLFENLHGATFQIWGTRYVTIRKSDWGPGTEPTDSESRITPDGGVLNSYPTHILLDRIQVHDQNSVDLGSHHNGGMELVAGRDITIRNSRFFHDAVYDIEVQDFTNADCCGMKYGNASNVTLEGNVFEAPVLGPPYGSPKEPAGQPEVQFDPQGGGWSDWTIRRNLFESGLATSFDGDGSFYRHFRVERNLAGRLSDCGGRSQGALWQDNVVARGRCGGRSVPFGYRLDDMRLVGGQGARSVGYVFGAVASGRSPARAAAMAQQRRLPAPPGGWTGTAAKALVTNSLYLGGRYGPSGAHRKLVGIRLWRRAQRSLARH